MTTRVGGNAELVREEIDGLLVPFRDSDGFRTAIGTALDRPWAPPQISARARGAGWRSTTDLVVRELDDVPAVARPAPAGSHRSVR